MRRIITLTLTATIILSLFASCQKNTTSASDMINSGESEDSNTVYSSHFESYESILNLYNIYAELIYDSYNTGVLPENIYLSDTANETEKELYKQTFDAMYSLQYYLDEKNIDEKTFKSSYGYALSDLNGDGTDELILMTQDYNLLAVYTMYQSSPVLLRCFSQRANGWIDENGKIHECASSSDSSTVISTFEIRGSKLALICEYGCDDMENQYYKKTETEGTIFITKDELDLAFKSEFLSLKNATVKKVFEEVLEGKRNVYLEDGSSMPLALCPTYDGPVHSYSGNQIDYIDFDNNGVDELILNTMGEYILHYDFEDDKVYAIFISPRKGYVYFSNGEFCHNYEYDIERYKIVKFLQCKFETALIEYIDGEQNKEKPNWVNVEIKLD